MRTIFAGGEVFDVAAFHEHFGTDNEMW